MSVKLAEWWPYIQGPYDDKWGYIWGASGQIWTQARQTALEEKYRSTGNPDLKMGAEYGGKWIGHHVIDCSGLPARAFDKCGVKIAHGSNSIWKSYLSHKGRLTPGIKLPKGTAIFTGDDSKKPHIGVYDGEKYVIEAQGTKAGVTRTLLTNSKWKYWGLFKDLEYDFVPEGSKEDKGMIYPTIRQGSKGDVVKTMQERLAAHGSSLAIDGIFGSGTRNAVVAFQKNNGLTADGICGPMTWGKLLEEPAKAATDEPVEEGKKHQSDLTLEQKVDILWAEYTARK